MFYALINLRQNISIIYERNIVFANLKCGIVKLKKLQTFIICVHK